VAGIGAFQNNHALVIPQPPVELAMADVDGVYAPRAPLQQHVGEAAGRGAEVERRAARRIELEMIERMGELGAAA
jgi:hypothetical protein